MLTGMGTSVTMVASITKRFEFRLNDVWVPARVEMGMDDKWYLVGLPGVTLDGLEVRQE